MIHPLTQDTKLHCDKGTTQTAIQVTNQSFAKLNSKLRATEIEKKRWEK